MLHLNPANWFYPATYMLPLCIQLLVITMRTAAVQAAPDSDGVTSQSHVTEYCNPIDLEIADPFLLKENGTYYLYGTTRSGNGLEVFESTDMVQWRPHGYCFEKTSDSWGKTDFWAPEVLKKDQKYYLYYTARNWDAKIRNTCVATSDSPLGPFIDIKAPMFPEQSYIDGHVYRDPADGEYYFYVTQEGKVPSTIVGARLAPSMVELATTFTRCLVPDQRWEDGWIEGPFITKHKDTYYMTYSGSAYWEPVYAVGYATAAHPLGPWKKYQQNPVLHHTPFVDGPGHNCIAESPDGSELFMVYHRHSTLWSTRRMLALDRIQFNPSAGGPDILTLPQAPSHLPQRIPSGSPTRRVGTSDLFDVDKLDLARWIILGENKETWKLRNGALTITTDGGDFWRTRDSGNNVFLQHASPGDFSISTAVTFEPRNNDDQAFLIVWQDHDNYLLFATGHFDNPGFATVLERRGKNTMFTYPNTLGSHVWLRLNRKNDVYSLEAGTDGKNWKQCCDDVQSDFRPTYVGLGAWAPTSKKEIEATFEQFSLEQK